ncbi:amine oxidase [Plakobranchus ocellatus]|uniref:Amine oxidase n=1 Tax=Plakobranchus ocellatus TaxID=259542 RepID=A0AAV3Z1T2_9GAST|nr:amine oxidase [Plakobranchus ocellatus]
MLRPHQVMVESESSQRKLQQDILPQDLSVETYEFLFKNDRKEEHLHPAPSVFIENFQYYLFHLLDQYSKLKILSRHGGSIPEDEIWIKIGGDHGQGSLKVTLQVLNIDKPNSKFHTSVIAIAQVPDNVHNFQSPVYRFKEQIKTLNVATWNGRKICIFLCGDCHFFSRCSWYIRIIRHSSLPLVPPDKERDKLSQRS